MWHIRTPPNKEKLTKLYKLNNKNVTQTYNTEGKKNIVMTSMDMPEKKGAKN